MGSQNRSFMILTGNEQDSTMTLPGALDELEFMLNINHCLGYWSGQQEGYTIKGA